MILLAVGVKWRFIRSDFVSLSLISITPFKICFAFRQPLFGKGAEKMRPKRYAWTLLKESVYNENQHKFNRLFYCFFTVTNADKPIFIYIPICYLLLLKAFQIVCHRLLNLVWFIIWALCKDYSALCYQCIFPKHQHSLFL